MCMSGKRMSEGKATVEIFLIVLKGIRSVFFNLFMLALGFALGFGFCEQCHKVFDRQGYQNFRSWVHGEKCANCANSATNLVESSVSDGK